MLLQLHSCFCSCCHHCLLFTVAIHQSQRSFSEKRSSMLYTVHSEDAAVCCCSCTAVSAPAATPACCSLLQYTNPRGASQKKGIEQCRDFFWKLLESVSILIWILSFFLNYQTCLRSGHCQTCTIVSLGNPPFFSVTNIQA